MVALETTQSQKIQEIKEMVAGLYKQE